MSFDVSAPPRVVAIRDMLVLFGSPTADVHYPQQDFSAGELTFPSWTIVQQPTDVLPVGPQFSIQQNVVQIQVRLDDSNTIGSAETSALALQKQFVNSVSGVPIRHASFELADLIKINSDLQTVDFLLTLETGLEIGDS